MNSARWWIAGVLCQVLVFLLTLLAIAFMALLRITHRAADRAELQLELADATARTRRDRKTNRIQSWKKPL